MTAVPTERLPVRSLLGAAVSLWGRRNRRGQAWRLPAAVTAARQHVMTLAALAAADLGAFQVWHHGGWFAVAGSLFLLDFAIRG